MTQPHRTVLVAARERLGALDDAERRYVAPNPLRLEHEHDMRGARYVVRARGAMGVNTRRKVELVGESTVRAGPFADGAVVASVPTRIVGPDPKLDMYPRVEPVLALAADGPGGGREVVVLLGELCDHVEQVVFAAIEPMNRQGLGAPPA